MICHYCKTAADEGNQELHGSCRGETSCDCQHKPSSKYIEHSNNLRAALINAQENDPYAQGTVDPGNPAS